MENASKALIIAGGMLIAILVVSLLVVGWNNLTDYNRAREKIDTVEQILKFNKEFESYNKGVVRGYELVSLSNLVLDTNTRYSADQGYKNIEVYVKFLKGTTVVDNLADDKAKKIVTDDYVNLNTFMENYYTSAIGKTADFAKIYKEAYFQCDRIVYDGEDEESNGKGSARVQRMYFTQITKK